MLERRVGGPWLPRAREHVFTGVAAEPPDFVLAVGGGGVPVQDGVSQ